MDNNTPFHPQVSPNAEQPPVAPPAPGAYGSGGFGPAAPASSASAPAYAQPPQPVAPAPFGVPDMPSQQPAAPVSGAPLQPAATAAPAGVNRKPGTAPWWLWVAVVILGAAVVGLATAVFLIK